MKKITTKEAIRVVGHLLETNSTKGSMARTENGESTFYEDPQASCFCLSGAVLLVEDNILGCKEFFLYGKVQRMLGQDPKKEFLSEIWDNCSNKKRKEIVEKLKSV